MFTLICMMTLWGCYKDETGITFTLPPATQSGANTFGFKLNNEVWTNYGKRCFLFSAPCQENLIGTIQRSQGELELNADQTYRSNDTVRSSSFSIRLKTNFSTGTFTTPADSVTIFYSAGRQLFERDYITPSLNARFSVSITRLDTLSNIASGTFSGTLFRRTDPSNPFATSQTDSIRITEGRFDVKLTTR